MIKKVLLAILLAATLPGYAMAQNYVIRTDGGHVFVDYGTSSGIAEGDSVNVYKIEVAQHPVTGRSMESRVLLERNVRVLTADRDTSVILLPDSRIAEGMRIEFEKTGASVARERKKGASGLFANAEGYSFSSGENLGLFFAGYRYSAGSIGVSAGAGLTGNSVDKFYYIFAGPVFESGFFLGGVWVSLGVTEDDTKIGGGGSLRIGYLNAPALTFEYNYYPSLGTSAAMELSAGFSGFFSPLLRIGWTNIQEESDAIVISCGADLRIGNSLILKPYVGAAALDTDRIGFIAGLDAGINF